MLVTKESSSELGLEARPALAPGAEPVFTSALSILSAFLINSDVDVTRLESLPPTQPSRSSGW